MKTETKIRTVLKCSHCGAEITKISYYEDFDIMSLSYKTYEMYECPVCKRLNNKVTIAKEHITEEITRLYTQEEMDTMLDAHEQKIKDLETMVDQLARALSDHKQGIDR